MSQQRPQRESSRLQWGSACALILFQCGALFLMLQAVISPLVFGVLACLVTGIPALRGRLTLPFVPAAGLVILVFMALRQLLPDQFISERDFVRTDAAFLLACCCLSLEVLVCFHVRFRQVLPLWFLFLAGLGFLVSADVRMFPETHFAISLLTGGFLTAFALYSGASRTVVQRRHWKQNWLRTAILMVILITGSAIGAWTSSLWLRYESQIERMLVQKFSPEALHTREIGFAGRGGLRDISAWKVIQPETISLRVVSDHLPGYLRGRVLEEFVRDQWSTRGPQFNLQPTTPANPQNYRPHDRLFAIASAPSGISRSIEIWPRSELDGAYCFLPLNTANVVCEYEHLVVDGTGTVLRPENASLSRYIAQLADDTSLMHPRIPAERDLYLQLPSNLSADVRELAATLFDGITSTDRKIRRVETFFQENFTYGLSFWRPRNRDALTYFLTERPPAHCEYFATATAILLRCAGVPSRYVTGYVATERNQVDGSWIVRRKDAHAWVEAYDEQRQTWVTVESTPSEGVPHTQDSRRRLFEALAYQFRKWREWAAGGALQGLGNWIAGIAGLSLLAVLSLFLLRASPRRRTRGRPQNEADPRLHQLMRQRALLDRSLARQGLVRKPEETLLQFVERLPTAAPPPLSEAIAAWYRQYLRLRFSGEAPDEALVQELADRRIDLVKQQRLLQNTRKPYRDRQSPR